MGRPSLTTRTGSGVKTLNAGSKRFSMTVVTKYSGLDTRRQTTT